MIGRFMWMIVKKKCLPRKLILPFLLLLISVALIQLCILTLSYFSNIFQQQYQTSAKSRKTLIDSDEHRRLIEEQLRNNADVCPYYGSEHGMFHPSVEHPRFIITGGAGFIGSHLVKHLRQLHYKAAQIKVLDNLWRGRLHNLQYSNGTWSISTSRDFCMVDLRKTDEALKFVRGADVVYHLADVVAGVDYVFSHQSSVYRDNILINSNTIHAAKTNKIKQLIYVGTACSFPKFLQEGVGIHSLREDQTYPAHPESSYGWSKLMGEYETELAQSSDFDVGIIRLHNVYGPYSDYSSRTSQVIPSLIRKALDSNNGTFIVWGSGEQYRDFIYVDDVIASLVLLWKKGMNRGVIQVGTAKATTIKQLAHLITELVETKLHKKMRMRFDPTQPQGDRGRIAVVDRAKKILEWQARIQIKKGVSATMSWILADEQRKQRILVIVIGEVRGGDLAWKSLHKHLLQPLDAHLAIYVSNWQRRTLLHDLSQYIWTTPEYKDWGVVFEMIAKECHFDDPFANKWRRYCEIHGIFMGGVSNCSHPGSAGILLAFRWLVQKKLVALDLVDKYDWFILTRADELYLCDHHTFFGMNEDNVLLPTGEYYEGWSDRHVIGRSSNFIKMINITTELVCRSDYWLPKLQEMGGEFNLEKIQKVIWSWMKLNVSEFPRSMFTVKRPEDRTRWSNGEYNRDVDLYGLKLKYPDEYKSAVEHCKIKNLTNALKVIDRYGGQAEDMVLN